MLFLERFPEDHYLQNPPSNLRQMGRRAPAQLRLSDKLGSNSKVYIGFVFRPRQTHIFISIVYICNFSRGIVGRQLTRATLYPVVCNKM